MPKIYEILAERYVLRSREQPNQPRAVIQMDTVVFGEVFAFTDMDISTKEAEGGFASKFTVRNSGRADVTP